MSTLGSVGIIHSLVLKQNGSREVALGKRLERTDYSESVRHGGDGFAAVFEKVPLDSFGDQEPDKRGWLSLDVEQAEKIRPKGSVISLYVRAFLQGPDSWGTLFFSDWIGLSVTSDGLAIAFLGQKTPAGATYRELPLGVVQRGVWLDLVVRVGPQRLDFFCNGVLRNSIVLKRELASAFESELLIGAFPGLPNFPEKRSNILSEARIDTVALWNHSLSDAEVAFLSGKQSLQTAPSNPTSQAITAYNEFYDASESKDVARCRRLAESMRAYMGQDPTRPVYHLTAPMGWIFDPAGAFQFQGKYHVFSYHNTYSLLCFSGHDHYASDDLIHWHDWPLGPLADSPMDAYGIWLTNHIVDDEGIPNIIYGGWGRDGDGNERGVRARSHDGLVSYTDKKVVFPLYHDGHVWKEGDTWYAITMRHSAFKNFKDPEILVFTSPDLDHWTERGVLFDFQKKFSFAEFPYLLSLGGKDVLMAGCYPSGGALYWLGRFDRKSFRFIPDDPEGLRVDYANYGHVFNPSIVDDKGPNRSPRRIIMAMDERLKGSVYGLPWNGVHVMPRVLTLEGNHLRQEPLPEIESLRGAHQSAQGIEINPGTPGFIKQKGDSLEIIAEFKPLDASVFGLKVRVSKDTKTYVRILFDVESGEFGVDGNIKKAIPGQKQERGPSYCARSKPVQVRVFLDKALIEVFVHGQTCTTTLEDINPAHDGVELFSEGGRVVCTKLDIWEMRRST